MGDDSEKKIVAAESVKGLEELHEDRGLVCMICREGYGFKSDDVLGIYTYR